MDGAGRSWTAGLLPAAVVAGVTGTLIVVCIGVPCVSTGVRHGLWLDRCPATDMRLSARIDASGLLRGGEGSLTLHPQAWFLDEDGVQRSHGFARGVGLELTLLDADGNRVEDLAFGAPERSDGALHGTVTLPEVPDGDYVVRATVDAGFESVVIDLALPLYAPAIVHVMSDRPLYKPGQEVLLRSAVLRRTDLGPIDGRPGRWRVVAPDGAEMLVEKTRAGAWGVAETSFPLDGRADVGTWTALYETGGSSDRVSFEVRPFRLPRLTVELATPERWVNVGEPVRLDGAARYASGAPVAGAPVVVRLARSEGRWPLPLAWEEPFEAVTGPDGRFRVEVGEVPADLIERAVISATAQVTEEAGEAVRGSTAVILSKDDLRVDAVTELGEGLVEGFNNRAYVRVMTPDGRPVPRAEVVVTNPWDELTPAREATADEDGVAALQLDPGAPVTVVDPAPPLRVRPMVPDAPRVLGATEVVTQRSLDMAERRALDAVYPDLAACGTFAVGSASVPLGVRVDASGAIREVLHDGSPAARCAAAAMRRVRFPAAVEATWQLRLLVPDTLQPSITTSHQVAWGGLEEIAIPLDRAALEARSCLARDTGIDGATLFDAHWRVTAGSTAVGAVLVPHVGTGLDPVALACLRARIQAVRLPEPADADALGTTRLSLSVPRPPNSVVPQATTRPGYELKVVAHSDGARIGSTRLVFPVGAIPPVRLRATPSIVEAGEDVVVEVFRGPDYRGELPTKLVLREGSSELGEAEVVDNAARFTIPDGTEGFVRVDHEGARAVIWVAPAEPLSLGLQTDKPTYRPGETATLTVTTRAGSRPVAAGVGLVGVDSTLGQLAPLLGPDDWGRVTVRATADRPAFGSFDPRALALGQVRGEHAAKAAVLRISQLPDDPAGDARTSAGGAAEPDTVEAVTTSFYRALERLIANVRAWESEAPEGELMRPPRMVAMWSEVLVELRRAGEPAEDAWGRELTLDVLPPDLLAQVDPRQVVADGTRLPEDVIHWANYVAEEVAR